MSVATIAMIAENLLDFAPYNPRKSFSEAAINELAESIRKQGLLQPIVVRKGKGKRYEVVCGSRRTRAARVAGLSLIPAIVRELTDQEALEASLTENLQRADVEPLEEADAIDGLLRSGFYTTDIAVADRLGRTRAWVARRRSLLSLTPGLRASAEAKEFPIGWYEVASRVGEEDQTELIERARGWNGPTTAVEAAAWVRNRNPLLEGSPFQHDDDTLVPFPACTGCPFNTASQGDLFDGDEKPRCMQRNCFEAKSAAFLDRRAEENSCEVLTKEHWCYRLAEEGEKGATTYVLDTNCQLGKKGDVVTVKLKDHYLPGANQPTPEANKERKEQLAKWKCENEVRWRILMAIYERIAKSTDDDCKVALENLRFALAAATQDNPWRGQDEKKPPTLEQAFNLAGVEPFDLREERRTNRESLPTEKQALVMVVQKATQGELAQKDAEMCDGRPHALYEIAEALDVHTMSLREAVQAKYAEKQPKPVAEEKPKRGRKKAS